MALSPKLEIRQSQSLVMTPQLMQAIKLLQLSNLDLVAYVDAELERNPLLERAEDDRQPGEPEAPENGAAAADEPAPGDWLATDMSASRSDMEGRLDTTLENVFPDDRPPEPERPGGLSEDGYGASSWSGIGTGGRDEGEASFDSFIASELSLADHLEAQLVLVEPDPRRRLIGRYLIDLVDEAGYLSDSAEAAAERLGADPAEVESVLAQIQRFDPSGVAARSLEECLAIQLAERNRLDPAMAALLKNLDLLARRDYGQLKRICRVDDEDIAEMIAEIRALNPKPGLAFGGVQVQPVIPDVMVRAAADGSWHIELNAETLPRVLVNQSYYATVSRAAKNDGDKSFLAECLQTATWLTRSLEQRARTILKVAAEIVRLQDGFLAYGVEYLRPLNLRMVADAIGMHESTVSRVTSNKYMATPRGIFEFKYFFTASIPAASGGDAHSAEAVRHRIRQMIDTESPSDILSDDTIVARLKDSGIDIARRTVAKYREAMRIPSSVQRRREKAGIG